MNSIYYNELGQFQALSKEEQLALVLKGKAGDTVAKEKLVKSQLKLVVHYAKGFEKYLSVDGSLTIDDLICEGNIALIEAIDSFHPSSGATISYYAGVVVKRRIISYLMQNNSSIRIPERRMKELLKLAKAANEAEDKNSVEKFTYNVPAKVQLPDFFEFTDENDDVSYLERWESIESALITLKPREKEIIEMYYGLNDRTKRTQEQIGKELGLSKGRINQIISKVINTLKQKISKER